MKQPAPIIVTKLRRPARRPGVLDRPHLLAKLEQVQSYPLAVIAAPAGYGKTTVLSWLDLCVSSDWRIAWYALGPEDGETSTFVSHLTATLNDAIPELCLTPPGFNGRHDPASAFDRYVSALVNGLEQRLTSEFLLVLDDVHHAEVNPDVMRLLDIVLRHLPARVHLVLAGRTAPPLPCLPKLHITGKVLTIDETDLQFSLDEIKQLFDNYRGLQLEDEIAAMLRSETEGWPAALQLAVRSLAARPAPVIQSRQDIDFNRSLLFEYLAQEVLRREPPAVQRFLVDSSVLPWVDVELCEAVLQRSDATAVLHHVEHSNLFLLPLEGGGWRYHHLFQDFLQSELRRDPQRWRRVHRAAAGYFHEQCESEEIAVDHWIEAGECEQAVKLIRKLADPLLLAGRYDTLRRWLTRLPTMVLDDHPELLLHLGRAQEQAGQWDEALTSYNRAEERLAADRDAQVLSRVLGRKGYLLWRKGQHREAENLHQVALQYLGEQHSTEQAYLMANLAMVELSTGHPELANELFNQALAIYCEMGDREGELATLLHPGAWLFLLQGEFEKALELLRRALAIGEDLGSKRHLAHCYISMASNLVRLGRDTEAQACALGALPLAREIADGELQVYALMFLGETTERLEGASQTVAAEHYRESLRLAEAGNHHRATVFVLFRLVELHRRLGNEPEELRLARRALSMAERLADKWLIALAQFQLGVAHVGRDDEAALQRVERALEVFTTFADKYDIARCSLWLTALRHRGGDVTAREHVERALRLARDYHIEAIFDREGKAALEVLGYALASPLKRELQELALALLERTGSDAVPELLRCLSSRRDRALQRQIIQALGNIGDARARRSLLRCSHDPALRDEALHALARLSPPGPPMLRIHCLGPFVVERDGEPISQDEWKTKKVRLLFKYLLAQRGHFVPRDRLIDVLWPDVSPEVAANRLRVALTTLRRALEPLATDSQTHFIEHSPDGLRFGAQGGYWLDVEEFTAAVEQARQHVVNHDVQQAIIHYQAAATLYRGEYLEEDVYEDWTEPERARLVDRYHDVLIQLARLYAEQHQIERAVDACRRALVTDALREDAYRLLMRLYALLGDTAEVSRVYRDCERVLARELGVAPAAETVQLYAELQSQARITPVQA